MPRKRKKVRRIPVHQVRGFLLEESEKFRDFLSWLEEADRVSVLGVDPSLSRAGVSLVEFSRERISLRLLARMETKPSDTSDSVRELSILNSLKNILGEYGSSPDIVVVEGPTYGSYRSETGHALFGMLFKEFFDDPSIRLLATPTPSQLKFWVSSLCKVFGVESGDLKSRSKEVFVYLVPEHVASGKVLVDDEAEAALLVFMLMRMYSALLGSELFPGEYELFFSQKRTRTSVRKGLIFRENQALFYAPREESDVLVRTMWQDSDVDFKGFSQFVEVPSGGKD